MINNAFHESNYKINNEIYSEENNYMSILVASNIVQEENITYNVECSLCKDFYMGVKYTNCNHYVCSICCYELYYKYVSDRQRPIYPTLPIYPYKYYPNTDTNEVIYDSITSCNKYREWFIYENADLWRCIKNNDLLDNIDINIKTWFETNESIKKHDTELTEYLTEYHKCCSDECDYESILEEERKANFMKLCRWCNL